MTKSKLMTIFEQNYQKCKQKLSQINLTEINRILVQSYIEDLNIGVTPYKVQKEWSELTFIHKPDFNRLSITQLAEQYVIAKAKTTLQVLDFSGFVIKNSSHLHTGYN